MQKATTRAKGKQAGDDVPAVSGTTGDLIGPEHQPLDTIGVEEEDALTLFRTFLYNRSSPEDRKGLSNAILTWDLLPKYSGERLNTLNELPNVHECEFTLRGANFKMVQLPGTIYRSEADSPRRYPGGREQVVEHALIKLACEQAEAMNQNGNTVYQVRFSIKQLQDVMADLGSKYKHTQIKESLEILSTSIITLYDEGGKGIRRMPILPGFAVDSPDGKATTSPTAQWSAMLHPIVVHAIRNAAYRQFNLANFRGHRTYGVHLLQEIILTATNISDEHPHTIRYTDLQKVTSGLNFARARDGINYLETEIKRMVKSECLSSYDRKDIKVKRSSTGRRALVDAEFTLYPGEKLIGEVKASSKRQDLVEKSLKLPRSKRSDRQISLPLS